MWCKTVWRYPNMLHHPLTITLIPQNLSPDETLNSSESTFVIDYNASPHCTDQPTKLVKTVLCMIMVHNIPCLLWPTFSGETWLNKHVVRMAFSLFINVRDGSTSSSQSGWHWITLKRQRQPRKDQSSLAVLTTTPASLIQLMLQS